MVIFQAFSVEQRHFTGQAHIHDTKYYNYDSKYEKIYVYTDVIDMDRLKTSDIEIVGLDKIKIQNIKVKNLTISECSSIELSDMKITTGLTIKDSTITAVHNCRFGMVTMSYMQNFHINFPVNRVDLRYCKNITSSSKINIIVSTQSSFKIETNNLTIINADEIDISKFILSKCNLTLFCCTNIFSSKKINLSSLEFDECDYVNFKNFCGNKITIKRMKKVDLSKLIQFKDVTIDSCKRVYTSDFRRILFDNLHISSVKSFELTNNNRNLHSTIKNKFLNKMFQTLFFKFSI